MKKNLFISLDLIKYRKYICIQSQSQSQSQSKSSLSSMGTSSVCSLSLSLSLSQSLVCQVWVHQVGTRLCKLTGLSSSNQLEGMSSSSSTALVRLRFCWKACRHLHQQNWLDLGLVGRHVIIFINRIGLGVEVQDRLDSRVEVWIWFGVGLGVKVQDRLDSRVEGQISRFQIDITFRLLSGREPKNRIESQ